MWLAEARCLYLMEGSVSSGVIIYRYLVCTFNVLLWVTGYASCCGVSSPNRDVSHRLLFCFHLADKHGQAHCHALVAQSFDKHDCVYRIMAGNLFIKTNATDATDHV